MCGKACENGDIHSNYECLAFQKANYKIDTQETNDVVAQLLRVTEKENEEIQSQVPDLTNHFQQGRI